MTNLQSKNTGDKWGIRSSARELRYSLLET